MMYEFAKIILECGIVNAEENHIDFSPNLMRCHWLDTVGSGEGAELPETF